MKRIPRPIRFLLFATAILVSRASVRERPLHAQATVEVGNDHLVLADPDGRALVEPSVAVDSQAPDHWLAATMVVKDWTPLNSDCSSLVTFDGGKTWTRHDFQLKYCQDVWVAFLPDGNAVLTALASYRGLDSSELLVFRSGNGGRTWNSNPFSLGSGYDHPTIVADSMVYLTSSYVTSSNYEISVARSIDQGRSFQEQSSTTFSTLAKNALNSVVRPDGTLLTGFSDFGTVVLRDTGPSPEHRFSRFQHAHSWVTASSDSGKTFGAPNYVGEHCYRGWQWLAQDESRGEFRGRLYWVCSDEQRNILVQHSIDGGRTWSGPVKVNRDGDPDPYAFTPMIAVNQDGIVGIGWHDGRDDEDPFKGYFRCHDVYFAASLDGGLTFLPERKVSTERSCPITSNSRMAPEAGFRFPTGGDYWGFTAGADGGFHLLWSDSRTGLFELRSATVTVRIIPGPK
jgi:hypothetical protein